MLTERLRGSEPAGIGGNRALGAEKIGRSNAGRFPSSAGQKPSVSGKGGEVDGIEDINNIGGRFQRHDEEIRCLRRSRRRPSRGRTSVLDVRL